MMPSASSLMNNNGEYEDYIPFFNQPTKGIKILVHWFFLLLKHIVYHFISKKQKDKIKVKIM